MNIFSWQENSPIQWVMVLIFSLCLQISPLQEACYPWVPQWIVLALLWLHTQHIRAGYGGALFLGLLWDALTYAPFGAHACALITALWWQGWRLTRPRVGLMVWPEALLATSVLVFAVSLWLIYEIKGIRFYFGNFGVSILMTLIFAQSMQTMMQVSHEGG